MCSLDLLELDHELRLAARVAIGVVLECKLSKGFPYFVLVCIRGHAERLVVINTGVSLHHRDGCGVVVEPSMAAPLYAISRQTRY
jgi:hypothetical protein